MDLLFSRMTSVTSRTMFYFTRNTKMKIHFLLHKLAFLTLQCTFVHTLHLPRSHQPHPNSHFNIIIIIITFLYSWWRLSFLQFLPKCFINNFSTSWIFTSATGSSIGIFCGCIEAHVLAFIFSMFPSIAIFFVKMLSSHQNVILLTPFEYDVLTVSDAEMEWWGNFHYFLNFTLPIVTVPVLPQS